MATASITPAAHLPLFDGFPYLTIRMAPAIYHVTLLPDDASERTLVGIAKAQWLANLLDVCLVIGPERALYINNATGPDRWDDTPPRGTSAKASLLAGMPV